MSPSGAEGDNMKKLYSDSDSEQSKYIVQVLYNGDCNEVVDSSSLDTQTHTHTQEDDDVSIFDNMKCLVTPAYTADMHTLYMKRHSFTNFVNYSGVWVEQLLSSLAYIHRNHVIHNDIRADNVYLDGDSNCVLSNFESSVHVEGDGGDTSLCGTLCYMSPESLREYESVMLGHAHIENTNTHTIKSDIFSAGVFAYLICADKYLYERNKEEYKSKVAEVMNTNNCTEADARDLVTIQNAKSFDPKDIDFDEFDCLFKDKDGKRFDPKLLFLDMLAVSPEERLSAEELLLKYYKVTKESDVTRVSGNDVTKVTSVSGSDTTGDTHSSGSHIGNKFDKDDTKINMGYIIFVCIVGIGAVIAGAFMFTLAKCVCNGGNTHTTTL
eukprot:GHVR01015720.1.p1 GENE.GHVR01015720.1~~GHVR01015720.1.p1  ORF type:complete len:409 (+),score=129.74 GHVR01015720.1:85-1227(+)